MYFVKWDEGGDPVAPFEKRTDAEEFAKALATSSDSAELEKLAGEYGENYNIDPDQVDRGSITLYKGELIGKVKVTFVKD